MKVTPLQLRSLVLQMLDEARKKGAKGKSNVERKKEREAKGPNGSGPGFKRDPMHDFSNPLGDENYLKRDGASAWGPMTGAREEPDVRVIDNLGRLPPDELREAHGKPPEKEPKKADKTPPEETYGDGPDLEKEPEGEGKGKLAPQYEKLIADFAARLKGVKDQGEVEELLRAFSRETEEAEGEDPAELEDPGERDVEHEMEQTLPVYESVGVWGSLSRALDEKRIGFKALKGKLAKKGAKDPAALAASIGRKKLGSKEMARRSAIGRRK